MKITPGNLYRTRDGRKAFVAYKNHARFLGMVKGEMASVAWDMIGVYPGSTDCLDLIAPWVDEPAPPSLEGVINYERLNAVILKMAAAMTEPKGEK
jgi:hypothetical protein